MLNPAIFQILADESRNLKRQAKSRKTFQSTTDDVVACWRCFELVRLTTGQMDPQNLSHLVNTKHPFLGSVYLIWLVVLNIFIFQNIRDNPSLWLPYFSRWLKPTSDVWAIPTSFEQRQNFQNHQRLNLAQFLHLFRQGLSIRALFMSGVTHGGFRSHGLPQWSNLSKRWGFSHGNPNHPASLDYWGIPIGNHRAAWWFLDFLRSAKSGLKIGHICSSNRLTPSYSPIKFMDTCGWLPSSSPLK